MDNKDELNQNPEERIGTMIKSTLTNLTDQDIGNMMEEHMLNLRLLKNVGLFPNKILKGDLGQYSHLSIIRPGFIICNESEIGYVQYL